MAAENFSEIALAAFKASYKRLVDKEVKFSLFNFISTEVIRRPIIGFFTSRSLENLADYLNESPDIRSFVLDYSELFFYKLQESNLDNLYFEHDNGNSKNVSNVNSVTLRLSVFLKEVLKSNRPDLEDQNSGVLLGKNVFISYQQDPDEIVQFVMGNAWVIAYYVLFMNFDSLDEFIRLESNKLNDN